MRLPTVSLLVAFEFFRSVAAVPLVATPQNLIPQTLVPNDKMPSMLQNERWTEDAFKDIYKCIEGHGNGIRLGLARFDRQDEESQNARKVDEKFLRQWFGQELGFKFANNKVWLAFDDKLEFDPPPPQPRKGDEEEAWLVRFVLEFEVQDDTGRVTKKYRGAVKQDEESFRPRLSEAVGGWENADNIGAWTMASRAVRAERESSKVVESEGKGKRKRTGMGMGSRGKAKARGKVQEQAAEEKAAEEEDSSTPHLFGMMLPSGVKKTISFASDLNVMHWYYEEVLYIDGLTQKALNRIKDNVDALDSKKGDEEAENRRKSIEIAFVGDADEGRSAVAAVCRDIQKTVGSTGKALFLFGTREYPRQTERSDPVQFELTRRTYHIVEHEVVTLDLEIRGAVWKDQEENGSYVWMIWSMSDDRVYDYRGDDLTYEQMEYLRKIHRWRASHDPEKLDEIFDKIMARNKHPVPIPGTDSTNE
ncbi:hypothetical protein F5878DRAFT_645801 [Lentinula raphanica]|uniref:Fungal-type protein kinase domain-containing protein n=1 Tax=Lentinula raphanica TaxID=153919 RepID=A0AA38NZN8_9AGAR|nr:hypothetical protein F5878DRAFT_645801 [Lentinula raphanica]